KPDRAVQLSVKHRDFTEAVSVSLQTDRGGRIRLGELADVANLTATSPEGTSHTWPLDHDRHSYYRTVHGVAGASLEMPYMGSSDEPTRGELSLLEVRGGTYLADRFKALSIHDGMLRVDGLPRGDYDLLFKQAGQRIRLRLADGDLRERYVLGGSRELEVRSANALQIATVTAGEKVVRIQLAKFNKFSRVHLFATRQQPAYSPFGKLSRVADAEPYQVTARKLTSLYVAGRSIGDEYQYIIDRRYAKKFPGVMVERPSLLLNPWAVRSTEAGSQDAEDQTNFGIATDEAPVEVELYEEIEALGRAEVAGFANLDFLGEASAVLVNLVPDGKGVITVPLAALGAHQHLHVVAVDPTQTAYRSISLPEKPMKLVDLRLATGLDPEEHFTQQKQITVVGRGEQFVLPNIATSRLETYDSLPRVYALYATLSRDAKLAEFNFILNWPKLTPEERQTLYSKHACHELNFFLWKKDRKFFEHVVQPYLANKQDKTFLDHWLLGNEVGDFLLPWEHARLNTIERILLSQRIAADRRHAVQDVRDRFALLPPDIDRQNYLFLTALQGRALDTDLSLEIIQNQVMAVPEDGPVAMNFGRISGGAGFGSGGMGGGGGAMQHNPRSARPGVAGKPIVDDLFGDVAVADSELSESVEIRRRSQIRPSLLELKEADKQQMRRQALEVFDTWSEDFEQARQLYQKLDKTQEWAEN
ncbi:MAG: hypothetical protein ABI614_23565, partial [Planctomycetota bacterium]